MFVGCSCRAASLDLASHAPVSVSTDGAPAVTWLRHCWPVAEKQSTSKTTLPHDRNRASRSATRRGIAYRKLIQTMNGNVGDDAGVPIGWIDFPMPEKTHEGSRRAAATSFFQAARLASNSAGGK
jgi:hypothetical protein